MPTQDRAEAERPRQPDRQRHPPVRGTLPVLMRDPGRAIRRSMAQQAVRSAMGRWSGKGDPAAVHSIQAQRAHEQQKEAA
jgi:hypothetical protein